MRSDYVLAGRDIRFIFIRAGGFIFKDDDVLLGESSLVSNMVLMLDGNSKIGAPVRSNFCYLICLRHLLRSREVTNPFF